jgi:phage tail-like protein
MNAMTNSSDAEAPVPQVAQRLPALLPAIYREDPFLARYLWAFEQALLDVEQRIDGLAKYFDPTETPTEFLPWLSSWVAFTMRADLGESQQRRFLARIAPLYRRRGTLQNLQELLTIFTRGGVPTITEDPAKPHFFHVTMRLALDTPEAQLRQSAIAHALIDLEKPAHTYYELQLLFPTMQIGVTSTIGVDTLLGTDTGAEPAAKLPPPARKS